MQSAGLRNKPLDRRHLTMDERATYNASGDHQERVTALKRVKAYRGQMAYEQNRPKRTVTRTPGTGGQNKGQAVLANRGMKNQARNERIRNLREGSEMQKKPEINGKLDTKRKLNTSIDN